MKRHLAVAAAAALVFALAVPAHAQVSAEIVIGTPPPPVVVETVPPPRAGFVWAPGIWIWNGGRHVWHPGHWEAERPGAVYVPAAWIETPSGWRFVPAHWDARGGPPGPPGGCPPGLAKQGRC
jgi:YXWGXW repeat-containing protein